MAYWEGTRAAVDRAREQDWNAASAIPSLVPSWPTEFADHTPQPRPSLCPEIDCVRHLLPAHIVAKAELRAIETGVGADGVLITWGVISEEAYVAALAASLGMAFEPLFNTPRQQCPVSDDQLIQAANSGMLHLEDRNGTRVVVAPRLVDSRRLVELAAAGGEMASRIRLTSTARLRYFVGRHTAHAIAYRAAEALRDEHPEMSAGTRHVRRSRLFAYFGMIMLAVFAAPALAMMAVEFFLGAVFLAWSALRLLGLLTERLARRHRRPMPLSDDRLPTYSIVIALYREATAAAGLVAALRTLDYPAEKLDIKFVLEPGDDETYAAMRQLQLGPPFEVIVAPHAGPRTKPKALNAALPFVRGKFVAVFDAEDHPEPDQLRLALEAFSTHSERLACVQARLTIDNTADGWLTRMFTAEYAGLFDVFLPGLAAWRLPLPLGGSSNHFRTDVLRQIGAWDPYNVTEDADLGMRLVRFGFLTAVIPSTTYEEAPARFQTWLKQRTRWFKGWLQTWLVHMRSPVRLFRELGPAGFIVFQLLVGGSALAALIHVPFAIRLGWMVSEREAADPSGVVDFDVIALVSGYLISAVLGFIGLARRNLLRCSWALLFMPVYWLLLSLAAWRALIQLLRDPYLWEKTEHGLARTSRLDAGAQR